MSDRRRLPSYWLARVGMNLVTYLALTFLAEAFGVPFSWWLWLVAFMYYGMMTISDALIDYYWPVSVDPSAD